MIEVKVSDGGVLVTGHAGYAFHGRDIVCAAVSAVTLTLIRSLEGLTEDSVSCRIEPGNTEIEFKSLSKQGMLLVDSFFIGCAGVASRYPEYVKIIAERA